MKKLIKITLILLLTQPSFSQYKSIFGSTSTSWNVLNRSPQYSMDSLVVCCDTNINSTVYKKIDNYHKINSSVMFYKNVFFMREDTVTGKVWIRSQREPNDVLIMNMSLNLNDTLVFSDSLYRKVDSVYTIGGRKVLRIKMDGLINNPHNNCGNTNGEPYLLVEGISFPYIINRNIHLGMPFCSVLLCKRKNGILVYQNTTSAYSGYCNSNFLGVEKILLNEFNIFPNPVSNIVNIVSAKEQITSMSIVNMEGKQIKNIQTNSLRNNLDISFLENGIYLLKIQTDKGVVVKKLVKE